MSSKPEHCESRELMTIFPSANVCSIYFNTEGLFATFHRISEQYDKRHQVMYKSISFVPVGKGKKLDEKNWKGNLPENIWTTFV